MHNVLPQERYTSLAVLMRDIHEASAATLAALVRVHVLVAVVHALRPGDHLFRRMLPRSLVP